MRSLAYNYSAPFCLLCFEREMATKKEVTHVLATCFLFMIIYNTVSSGNREMSKQYGALPCMYRYKKLRNLYVLLFGAIPVATATIFLAKLLV